jgi:hypothetical protein
MPLTRQEKGVLRAVISACGERGACLIAPEQLLSKNKGGRKDKLPETTSVLTRIVRALEADGYFERVQSRKDSQDVWCITLLLKGKGYERKLQQTRRYLLFKVAFTVGLAVLSFLVGILLKRLF